MGRLIDASNLNFEGQHYNKSQMKAILDFVDAQPTAYDVEKVIERLIEWTCEANIILPFGKEVLLRKVIASKNAIEIVRSGGVE